MGLVKRKCDNCKKEYEADTRNLKRGWGLCCSKSCAASKREKNKPKSNKPKRTYSLSIGRTSEGYRVEGGVAYDEFGEPIYNVGIGEYDSGDSEYWDNSDNGSR